jgi:hypothetical protein
MSECKAHSAPRLEAFILLVPLAARSSCLLDFINGSGDISLGAQVELQYRWWLRAGESRTYNPPSPSLEHGDNLSSEQAGGAGDQSSLAHGDNIPRGAFDSARWVDPGVPFYDEMTEAFGARYGTQIKLRA